MRSFFFPYLLTYGRTFPPPVFFFNTYRYVDTHLHRGFSSRNTDPMGENRGDRRERGPVRGVFRVFAKRKCVKNQGFSIRKWGFRFEFDALRGEEEGDLDKIKLSFSPIIENSIYYNT